MRFLHDRGPLSRALAAAQGPADPAPLAAAGRAAARLRRADRALLGFAVQRDDTKPKVAFLNEVPSDAFGVQVGSQKIDTSQYANHLFDSVDPIRVKTRQEAIDTVRRGDAIAALIIPSDLTRRLQSLVNLAGTGAPPTVEVLYNEENPLKTQAVESRIKSRVADANKAISDKLTQICRRLPRDPAARRLVLPAGPEVLDPRPAAHQRRDPADAAAAAQRRAAARRPRAGRRTSRSWRSTTSTSASRCSRRSASRCTSSGRS